MNQKSNNISSNFRNLFNVAIILALFFFFPIIEKPLVDFAQTWINNFGIFAPIGYILFGLLSTVIAPIGLGPVNIVLQRAFGFWPSVFYFWTYETIGISINFILSTYFGTKIIKYLFYAGDERIMKVDPVTKLSTYMLNKNYLSAFVCMLGFGGELIGYLAGLSKLSYLKFLSILIFTNFINALLFVGSNLTIGTNNTLYIAITILNFLLTSVPVAIVFRKEIRTYITNIITTYKLDKEKDKQFQSQLNDFIFGKSTNEEFNLQFIEHVEKEVQNNLVFMENVMPNMTSDYDMEKLTTECFNSCYKKLQKQLPQETSLEIYKTAKHHFINKFQTSQNII